MDSTKIALSKIKKSGKCIRCGECCKIPPSLLKSDIVKISKYLKMSQKKFIEKYVVKHEGEIIDDYKYNFLTLKRVITEHEISHDVIVKTISCPFLEIISIGNKTFVTKCKTFVTKCMIQKVKPLMCKTQMCSNGKLDKDSVYDWWLFQIRNV